MQIVLKDMPGIDSNDQNSILEHLDKVVCVGFLILNDNIFLFFLYCIICCALFVN
jgi:hypothetical protein